VGLSKRRFLDAPLVNPLVKAVHATATTGLIYKYINRLSIYIYIYIYRKRERERGREREREREKRERERET
jgi:cob(I)alamin adenosyltransferase